jgi:hypothetical protein
MTGPYDSEYIVYIYDFLERRIKERLEIWRRPVSTADCVIFMEARRQKIPQSIIRIDKLHTYELKPKRVESCRQDHESRATYIRFGSAYR